eukprot:287500-Amphidinium_carterae.1
MQKLVPYAWLWVLSFLGSTLVKASVDLSTFRTLEKQLATGAVEPAVQQLSFLIDYLRAGDMRLVRPSPSEVTAQRQKEIAAHGGIRVSVMALGSGWPILQAHGAEIIHLLTTNNPRNRADIAAAGAIPKLVALVHAGSAFTEPFSATIGKDQVRAAEEAAEALWILAFAGGGEENAAAAGVHVKMAAEGAAAALADLVWRHPSERAVMWAGAALGNLMAVYPRVPSKDSEAVRQQVLSRQELVTSLVANLDLRVKSSSESSKWPSLATKDMADTSAIAAWGAGQALKNLALTEAGRTAIIERGGVTKLCKLKGSPDWLEELKGRATLENLGVECMKVSDEEL